MHTVPPVSVLLAPLNTQDYTHKYLTLIHGGESFLEVILYVYESDIFYTLRFFFSSHAYAI